ncbi:DNA helicase [Arthrobacter phage Wollypog]|uniref:DNA helicase n=1 Tax=Arthrobacter phage Wollypog TaxID=2790985 RepID=A0A7T3KCI2_9CAUD|nr:DNA helicase [Arthrobacter phage Wollypog]QPX62595.1 DNA helicase [Arthrobacter phage Wollypog]
MEIPVYADLPEGSTRINVKSAWYADAAFDAKRTPGARWDKQNRVWTYPLTMDACYSLRSVYGDRLKVGARLSNWARNAISLEDRMRSLGTAEDAELTVVPQDFPFMAKAMANRTYQRAGAKFIAEGRRVGLFDEVGLGKTITALGGVIEAGEWAGDHLVISTKSSLWAVWMDQVLYWTENKAEVFVCDGALDKRKKTIQAYMESTAESKWLVINPAMLMVKKEQWCNKCKKWERDLDIHVDLDHWTLAHKLVGKVSVHKYPELQTIPWGVTIIDEAHKVLSTGIKSAQKLTQTAEGLKACIEKRNSMRIALTGTPARGKELKMWGIMHWLWPETYPSKWDWVFTYFQNQKGYGDSIDIGPLRDDMRDRFWAMLDKHTLRRTRREVRADLPQAEAFTEWVHLDGRHKKQYEEMEKTGEANIDGGEVIAIGILAEMTRLKQFAYGTWKMDSRGELSPTFDSPKLERLLDMLEERGITERGKDDDRPTDHYKYIVASQFKEIIDSIGEKLESLGIPSLKITGDVTGPKRATAARSFQEDPEGPRILLMTITAGGESLTLDRYCDTIFAIDETFVADDGVQLLGRIDNRSVTAEEAVPRQVIHIATKDTIEEGIAQSNIDQLQMEHMLLDARRGVELAKNILRRDK